MLMHSAFAAGAADQLLPMQTLRRAASVCNCTSSPSTSFAQASCTGGHHVHRPCFASRAALHRRCLSTNLSRSCTLPAFVHSDVSVSQIPGVAEESLDVLGFGQAMVDFSATVGHDFLADHGLEAGCRRVITVRERGDLLRSLDGSDYQVSPGGSLANSLVAYAKLAKALQAFQPVNAAGAALSAAPSPAVAMSGPIGSDHLGEYFQARMAQAGVSYIVDAAPASHTGTVAVLTTPDAQRSFLSYLGSEQPLVFSAQAKLQHTRTVLIEGYMWEAAEGPSVIRNLAEEAAKAGAQVALTCGDAGVVERHSEAILQLAADGLLDILFANKAEALQLVTHLASSPACRAKLPRQFQALADCPAQCARLPADVCASVLGSVVPLAVVTDGANGAAVSQEQSLYIIPPHWQKNPPQDTNGAGDAFCGAFLFGMLGGMGVSRAGRLAARTAGAVITRKGAALTTSEARQVVLAAFGLCELPQKQQQQVQSQEGGAAATGRVHVAAHGMAVESVGFADGLGMVWL